MFAYLAILVEFNLFDEVYLSFLPPGHTHSNLDQKYSVISQRLRNKDLLTLEQVMYEVDGLFQDLGPLTRNLLVPAIADYSLYFSGFLHDLHGHGTCKVNGVCRRLHAFKIARSDNGVGIYFKEHDEFGKWKGRWDIPAQAVELFSRPTSQLPSALVACPKERLDKIDEVMKHWKAVSGVVKPTDNVLPGELLSYILGQYILSNTWGCIIVCERWSPVVLHSFIFAGGGIAEGNEPDEVAGKSEYRSRTFT